MYSPHFNQNREDDGGGAAADVITASGCERWKEGMPTSFSSTEMSHNEADLRFLNAEKMRPCIRHRLLSLANEVE